MSEPIPLFRTTNWSSDNIARKRRGVLMVWLDPEMYWFAAPSGMSGHPERLSAATIQFCLSIMVWFGLRLRQATGFVASLRALSGLGRVDKRDFAGRRPMIQAHLYLGDGLGPQPDIR